MMTNIKISLIFACYNVSQYLQELYQLVITQPYQNIEIIFVEDCSTDNTKEILRSFTDERVKLIENSKNQGAAISRNIGITCATGDYVWFPDPDDLFDKMLITEAADILEQISPSVLICGMREEYEQDGKLEYTKDITSLYSGYIQSNFKNVLVNLEEIFLFGYTNNKFYKSSILFENNIKNKSLALKEDFEFNIQVFSLINDFYILNKPYYFYKKRRNGNSLTSKFVPDYFEIHLNSVLMFKELLERKGGLSDPAKSLLVDRFFRYFLSAVERNSNQQANLSFTQQKDWIKNVIESDKRISWFLKNKRFMRSKLKFLPILVNLKAYASIALLGHLVKYIKQYAANFFTKLK